jgi:hypothetical protein
LSPIEKEEFFELGLVESIPPSSVELFGVQCFFGCESLSSVTFESGSKLLANEREVLQKTGWFGRDGGNV